MGKWKPPLSLVKHDALPRPSARRWLKFALRSSSEQPADAALLYSRKRMDRKVTARWPPATCLIYLAFYLAEAQREERRSSLMIIPIHQVCYTSNVVKSTLLASTQTAVPPHPFWWFNSTFHQPVWKNLLFSGDLLDYEPSSTYGHNFILSYENHIKITISNGIPLFLFAELAPSQV